MAQCEADNPFSATARWALIVAVMIAGFIAFNSFPALRPLWQLLDAGATMKRPVDDLRCLLTGIDCYREAGFRLDESLLQQACATNGVPLFNQPSAWFLLAYIPGISVKNVMYVSVAWYILLGITLVLLFRRESNQAQLLVLAALLSPSIVLMCERGNNDLVIFCLVSWAALLLAGSALRCELTAAILLVAASFLKLYPIAAFVSVLGNGSWRRRILFAACVVAFSLGAIALRSDVRRVTQVTVQSTHSTYGAKVMIYELLGKVDRQRHADSLQLLWKRLQARSDYGRLVALFGAGFQICAALVCLAGGFLGMKARDAIGGAGVLTLRQKTMFLAGTGIYTATFVVHNNWSYRLVFLVLCIPALSGLVQARLLGPVRWLFGSLLGIIVAVCWLTPIFEPLEYFVIHNILHWLAAAGLSFAAAAILRSSVSGVEVAGKPCCERLARSESACA